MSEATHKKIFQVYAAFLVAVTLNFVPSYMLQMLGMLFFFVLFIAAYVLRNRADEKSLMRNHMIFIIKSVWISSLLLLVGIIVAFIFADHTIINTATNQVMNGYIMSEEDTNKIMMEYMQTNLVIFIATLVPSVAYLVYRLVKGMITIKDNQPIQNLKSWL